MDNISVYSIVLFFASAALFGYLLRYFWEAYQPKKQLSYAAVGAESIEPRPVIGNSQWQNHPVPSNVFIDSEGIIYQLECENNELKQHLAQFKASSHSRMERNTAVEEEQLKNLKTTIKGLLEQKELLEQKNSDLLNTVASLESQFRDLYEKSAAKNDAGLESRLAASEAALAEQIKMNEILNRQTDELYEKLDRKIKAGKTPTESSAILSSIGTLEDPVKSLSGNVKLQMTRLREAERNQENEPARTANNKSENNQHAEMKKATELLGVKVKWNDLKLIEGIGPKIEALFHAAGIKTWQELAETTVDRCREILQKGGERFQMHNPATWPRQSKMLNEGKWKQLKEYQLSLDGGKAKAK
jgi:predicted flap endonuclease-1-like 5' DNA nuclease